MGSGTKMDGKNNVFGRRGKKMHEEEKGKNQGEGGGGGRATVCMYSGVVVLDDSRCATTVGHGDACCNRGRSDGDFGTPRAIE